MRVIGVKWGVGVSLVRRWKGNEKVGEIVKVGF